MNKWQVLLVKEIKHLFRDTKTIVQTVVVPTFITPLLIGAIFWYVGSIATEETKKTYDISVYSSSESLLITDLDNSDRLAITKEDSLEAVIEAVIFDESEIGLAFDDAFVNDLTSNNSAQLTIYSKDIDTFSQAKSIVSNIIDDYEESIRNNRLELLNIDENYVNPITINDKELAIDAISLMEHNIKKPISVLPVINDLQKMVGILRLHDLVQAGIK